MWSLIMFLWGGLRLSYNYSAIFSQTLILMLLAASLTNSVHAHEGRPVFIELKAVQASDSESLGFIMKWKVPPVLVDGQEPLISLLADSCELVLPNKIGDTSMEGIRSMAIASQGLIGAKRYRCKGEIDELAVSIKYPAANPALSSLIVFSDASGVSRPIFSAPEKDLVLVSGQSSLLEIATQYVVGGVKHILIGWDHLLFVLCLIIIAGSLTRILIAVTGFTIAHTITLVLASLNLVALPNLFVETLIALSIAVLAAEILNVRRKLPNDTVIYKPNPQLSPSDMALNLSLSWRFPVIVAVGFGFVHGFGFASVLSDLGLPHSMKITALLFFNIGVELGQFLFIALVIGASLILSRFIPKRYQAKIINLGTYLIGVMASYWLIQRLVDGVVGLS